MDLGEMMKNLPGMMGKVKEMQGRMAEVRAEGGAGGGMVTATVNGAGELVGIRISPEAVDPEEIELLEDLVVAACADAKRNAAAAMQEKLSELTGGLDLSSLGINLPGMG